MPEGLDARGFGHKTVPEVAAVVDVEIENHGSIWIFRPKTDQGRDWLVENTEGIWWGGGLAIEPRWAQGLCDGMEWEGVVCG